MDINSYFAIQIISEGKILYDKDYGPGYVEPKLFKTFKEAVDYLPTIINDIKSDYNYGKWDIVPNENPTGQDDNVCVYILSNRSCEIYISVVKMKIQ